MSGHCPNCCPQREPPTPRLLDLVAGKQFVGCTMPQAAEFMLLIEALEEAKGNQRIATKLMGFNNTTTMARRMEKYGLRDIARMLGGKAWKPSYG